MIGTSEKLLRSSQKKKIPAMEYLLAVFDLLVCFNQNLRAPVCSFVFCSFNSVILCVISSLARLKISSEEDSMMETHWSGEVCNTGLSLMPAGTCVVKGTEIRCKNGSWCPIHSELTLIRSSVQSWTAFSSFFY